MPYNDGERVFTRILNCGSYSLFCPGNLNYLDLIRAFSYNNCIMQFRLSLKHFFRVATGQYH